MTEQARCRVRSRLAWALPCLLLLTVGWARCGLAQARPTASRPVVLDAFGMGTGVWTHYGDGQHNLSVTGGGDLLFPSLGRFSPGFELRVTVPISSGQLAGEYTYLGGGRVGLDLGRLHPYVDGLFGLGRINLVHPTGTYRHDNSTIYDGGAGLEYDVARGWAVRSDVQFQHWNIGTAAGGTFTPVLVNVGVSYRFFAGRLPQ